MTQATLSILDILIVEDSRTQAMLLKEALEHHQLHVSTAEDGVDAIEQIRKQRPQVIISDIEMPRMNGFELCKQLRSDPNFTDLPVILLTGLTDPMDVIKGIACGADSFLTKPCEINFLLSTVRDVVHNKQTQKQCSQGQSMAFFFNGKNHTLQIDQVQITNLLLSTYLNAMQKNQELEQSLQKLNTAYEEIKKKNCELETTNKQKNQLLGMAAHDLRNPLGVITGYCTLLKTRLEGTVDQKSITMLDKISISSTFMLSLINDMLDVSVIESCTVSLHLNEVDLMELIQEDLLLLNVLAEKKGVQLIFSPKSTVPKIVCDANKISQVLNNLVSNSIKFSRPGGKVEIALEVSTNDITITITDHGTGIAPEMQQHLFQPFTQEGQIGTAGEKSTGLGLSIVQKIVTKHNGKISLNSKLGSGTTFSVSLPRSLKEYSKISEC